MWTNTDIVQSVTLKLETSLCGGLSIKPIDGLSTKSL